MIFTLKKILPKTFVKWIAPKGIEGRGKVVCVWWVGGGWGMFVELYEMSPRRMKTEKVMHPASLAQGPDWSAEKGQLLL